MSVLPTNGGESRCHVCRSPHRVSIDVALADPAKSAADVASSFPSAGISERSMRRHRSNGHRHSYEGESASDPERPQVGTDRQGGEIVDAFRLGREVINQTWERLVDGQIRPNLQDAYRFIRILEEFDLGAEPIVDEQMLRRYFWAMVRVSEAHMNGNQRAYRNAINSDVDIQTVHWIVAGHSMDDIPNEGDS